MRKLLVVCWILWGALAHSEPCTFSITATGPVTLMPKNQAEVISIIAKQMSMNGCAWVKEQNAKYRIEFGYWCFLDYPKMNPGRIRRFTRSLFNLVFGQEEGLTARVMLRDGSNLNQYSHSFFVHRGTFKGVERVMMLKAERVLNDFAEQIEVRER